MIGEQIDTRRWYGKFDKQVLLKKTKGICACCGAKLTEKTMTVEHIIPISRGGWDIEANMLPLCETCNKLKGNMLCIPAWFYIALIGTPLIEKITEDFCDWFMNVKDKFNIQQFPLITPCNYFLLRPAMPSNKVMKPKRKNLFISQLRIGWMLVGKEWQPEVEAETGIRISKLYHTLIKLSGRSDYKGPMTAYGCKKISSGKIIALSGIMYSVKEKRAYIILPWTTVPDAYKTCIFFSIIRLFCMVTIYGEYDLEEIYLYMPRIYESSLKIMTDHYIKELAVIKQKPLYGNTKMIAPDKTTEEYICLNIYEHDMFDKESIKKIIQQNEND